MKYKPTEMGKSATLPANGRTDNNLALARPRASKARQRRCQEEILPLVRLMPNNYY